VKRCRGTNHSLSPTVSDAIPDFSLAGDPLLSTADAAKLLGVSQKTLRDWRCSRSGPRCLKMGAKKQSRTVYRQSDLDAWVRTNATVIGGTCGGGSPEPGRL